MITSDKVYKNLETNKGYKEDDLIMGSDLIVLQKVVQR